MGNCWKFNGIFDDESTPYNIVLNNLKRKNLAELQQSDSGYIYNQFAEILRHNVVSDKPNAFNKMFNLILAKIVDEDRNEDDVLHFQWKEDDTDIEMQKRLNDLYKKGMKNYLDKDVTDLADEELDIILKMASAEMQKDIREKVTTLRLHKSNEFAFHEVFDERSFKENAIVVKEAVKLLQPYQLRYSHKQQFLSNFFELLLSNTLKQEAGQFFTPVPVARFIVSSIPFKEIIDIKIQQGKRDFLPATIDFAAGSGHFLTEAMDEIQQIIDKIDTKNLTPTVRKAIQNYQDNSYYWAEKFMYGIEKDYRLSKIAKVSCFLNGDGLANIVHADGLDPFDGENYKNAPLLKTEKFVKDNPQFDVLVANPPFSVGSFVKTLKEGNKCFDIFPAFTEKSSEIECAFIERGKQILVEGGYTGIILPSTILNNGGAYTKTREMLLKYFKIIAVVEFGPSTFMATGTNTIALFMQRRTDKLHLEITESIKTFFYNYLPIATLNGIENPFETYAQAVYGIALDDYATLLHRQPNETIEQTELMTDYRKWYDNLTEIKTLKEKISSLKASLAILLHTKPKTPNTEKTKLKYQQELDKIEERYEAADTKLAQAESDPIRFFYEKVLAIEQDKMLYFFLTLPQTVLLVKTNPSGDKEQEKEFLGYEFSGRRGNEGLKVLGDTRLYNDADPHDPTRISSYIYNAMLGNLPENIHDDLQDYFSTSTLTDMITFNRVAFEKEILLSSKKKSDIESIFDENSNLVFLKEIATLKKGISITKKKTDKTGKIPVIAGGKEPAYFHNEFNELENVITVSASGANAGFVGFHNYNIWASDCITIRSKDESKIPTYLIYQYLVTLQSSIYDLQRGQAQPHVYSSDLEVLKIPNIEDFTIQQRIITEISEIEAAEIEDKGRVAVLEAEIWNLLDTFFVKYPKKKLIDVAVLERGRFNFRPRNAPHLYHNGIYPFIQTGNIGAAQQTKIDYTQQLNEEGLKVSRLFQKGTILITIAANIGNTAILDYDACFPDSVVSIRPSANIINIKYLEYYLRTQKEYLNEISTKTAQKNLNLERLSPLLVSVPPIELQNSLIKKIDFLEDDITALKNQLSHVAAQKQEVLKKYL
jgi:type I restriction enzyme M protein